MVFQSELKALNELNSLPVWVLWITLIALTLCLRMQDAFSLLAYSDPWSSPVGYQLDSIQREPVCSTLNSAILGKTA